MIFEICRTSGYSEKPCEEAFKGISGHDPSKRWYISIENLDELIALSTKYGELILLQIPFEKTTGYIPQLEIYDGCRE